MLTAQLWNPESSAPMPLTSNQAKEPEGSGKKKGEGK